LHSLRDKTPILAVHTQKKGGVFFVVFVCLLSKKLKSFPLPGRHVF